MNPVASTTITGLVSSSDTFMSRVVENMPLLSQIMPEFFKDFFDECIKNLSKVKSEEEAKAEFEKREIVKLSLQSNTKEILFETYNLLLEDLRTISKAGQTEYVVSDNELLKNENRMRHLFQKYKFKYTEMVAQQVLDLSLWVFSKDVTYKVESKSLVWDQNNRFVHTNVKLIVNSKRGLPFLTNDRILGKSRFFQEILDKKEIVNGYMIIDELSDFSLKCVETLIQILENDSSNATIRKKIFPELLKLSSKIAYPPLEQCCKNYIEMEEIVTLLEQFKEKGTLDIESFSSMKLIRLHILSTSFNYVDLRKFCHDALYIEGMFGKFRGENNELIPFISLVSSMGLKFKFLDTKIRKLYLELKAENSESSANSERSPNEDPVFAKALATEKLHQYIMDQRNNIYSSLSNSSASSK